MVALCRLTLRMKVSDVFFRDSLNVMSYWLWKMRKNIFKCLFSFVESRLQFKLPNFTTFNEHAQKKALTHFVWRWTNKTWNKATKIKEQKQTSHFWSMASYRVSCKDWSDCTDGQADLSLRHCVHMQSCRKYSAPAKYYGKHTIENTENLHSSQ